ncbi:MAG: toll/interleukin-1 receptor domain-containing protein, partial [Woeseiaceae bacterium]|nr:toll/interleukin-1 receptor domain-containing protein [Woeseiaceae bacterium]
MLKLYSVRGCATRSERLAKEFKYKAFISYSHSDEKWATWLHRSLENYKVPKPIVGNETAMGEIPARLAPVFRDRDELPSATNLGELLTQSLEDSATQIVICSPAAANSNWVNEEILTYKRLGRSNRIFCLIVDGEPWASDKPGQEEQECFPPALRHELGDSGELSDVRAEPIAADARPEGDGKVNARLKLISGMLGVGFDALKQREQHRRHQRMLVFTTAAFVGMAITSGLAVTA